ncbi:MAG: hypothetical protein IKQ55_07475, partial [Kiritimatiellae bacterium]|nr:hypothetical protein [Kiritimatiellia bacterium]
QKKMPLSMHHASTTAVTEHGPPTWNIYRNGSAWNLAPGGPRSVAAVWLRDKEQATEFFKPL